MDGLLNYLIPLWRDSMSSSPASAVSSVGFAELRSDGDFKVLRKAKLWSILGCLLQPGLLLNQPLKSMRANSFQLIKFCCTRTDPAARTKSIGLQAKTSASSRNGTLLNRRPLSVMHERGNFDLFKLGLFK
jgi:hypothetical protein